MTGNGFIHRIVPAAELATAAHEAAERVAGLAPLAVAGMKQLVREDPDEDTVRSAMAACAESDDVREGLAAMREKRAPKFKGR